MLGSMQHWPLTLDKILDHARIWHGKREMVTRSIEGPILRTTYANVHARAKQVSNALLEFGICKGDRVATLAFNTARHVETWYGIMGIGAVCHTLNPRLFVEQLVYIVNHASDRLIFADAACAPLLEKLLPRCPSIERVVLLTDGGHLPAPGFEASAYEHWIDGKSNECVWGDFSEETAAGLCYTSGTTDDPRGVLYSHRSNFLHTLTVLQPDVMGLCARDVILPIVPMFHANAWGLAFAGPAVGAKLVLPGAKLDGASIYDLIESEDVTYCAGVPTVLQGLMQHMDRDGLRFTTLKRVLTGGSACPESLLRRYADEYGVTVEHAWGMTEMSPVGTVNTPTPETINLTEDEQHAIALKQGRPPLGVELELVNDAGQRVPCDGRSFGRLTARGPAITRSYFHHVAGDVLDDAGFFDTGDIATIDPHGYVQITDRAKDVIKSGGEWVSSIAIENAAIGHPKAAITAVVAMPDEKWGERPLLIVQLKPGVSAVAEDFLQFLQGRIPKWWMPVSVRFVDSIPLGATGKIDKKALRQRYRAA